MGMALSIQTPWRRVCLLKMLIEGRKIYLMAKQPIQLYLQVSSWMDKTINVSMDSNYHGSSHQARFPRILAH